MADKDKEMVQATADQLGGKKAKVKALQTEPEGTTSKPLERGLRVAMEEVFGAKLKDVLVHTGGNIPDVAKELKAKVFTIGTDIYFAKAADAKDTQMLAHEIAHVLNQGTGKKMPAAKKGKALTSK